jgi:hypothetical protein
MNPRTPRAAPRTAALVALAALSVAFAPACASLRMDTPADFARVESPRAPYEYRAVAAYGVALAVRSVPNEGHASLDFWAEAVDRTLRGAGPYHPAGTLDVRTNGGLPGRRLAYVFGNAQSGSVYWVTLFVTPARVYVVEAGGPPEAFARARAGVERATVTLTPP